MHSHGLETDAEIIGDGKLHRFHVEGDTRGKENGWYILHVDDRPAGQFGSWKTAISETWTAKIDRKLNVSERKELERKISEQRKQREAEEARVQAEAAIRAQEIWSEATTALLSSHPYLARKGIHQSGVRFSRDALVVPMRDSSGKLWSLQFIQEDGTKRYLSGGRKQGCYFTIGKPRADQPLTICVCEGFATAASIHAATELAVAVAFDSGNLEPVSIALRKKYPDARFVICADNDQYTKRPVENPGVYFARKAAEAVAADVAIPEFKHSTETNPLTDFNDLALSEGLPRVAEIVEAAIDPYIPDYIPEQELSADDGSQSENLVPIERPAQQEIIDEESDVLFELLSSLPSKHSTIAQQLADSCRNRVIYDELRARFYVFSKVWRSITEGDIQRHIQRVLDEKLPDGYRADTLNSTFKLFKLKVGRGKTNAIEWNERGYVPVQNGLINLATSQLEPFSIDRKIDWILPYAHDTNAMCPTFDTLIERLSSNNADTFRLLITFLAAIVRCRSDLQKYLELVGAAGSGKSSYMRVAEMLVGRENAVSSNMRHLGTNRFETAGFYGKRLALFPDERDHVAEGTDVFKALTGGDGIRYEQKGLQQGENFTFTGLVIVACNTPMTFEDYSGAIPRRRMSVHIDYSIRSAERDPHFMAKLASEMPGVLSKLLKISDAEIEDVFLDRTGRRNESTTRALVETNPVYDWFDQRIVLDSSFTTYVGSLKRDSGVIIGTEEFLYPNFVAWMEEHGRRGALSLRKFISTLRELVRSQEFPVTALSRSNRGVPWQGIRLRAGYDCEQPTPITRQLIKAD